MISCKAVNLTALLFSALIQTTPSFAAQHIQLIYSDNTTCNTAYGDGEWELGTSQSGGCAQNKAVAIRLIDMPKNKTVWLYDDYRCKRNVDDGANGNGSVFYLKLETMEDIKASELLDLQFMGSIKPTAVVGRDVLLTRSKVDSPTSPQETMSCIYVHNK